MGRRRLKEAKGRERENDEGRVFHSETGFSGVSSGEAAVNIRVSILASLTSAVAEKADFAFKIESSGCGPEIDSPK